MDQKEILQNLPARTSKAVSHYWGTRTAQKRKQEQSGKADQGLRSAVTGGAQMDGFIDLLTELITGAGITERSIFREKAVELPGFFRPTKEWDLLVVRDHTLIAAIDLWTAYREHAYLASPSRFLAISSCWRTATHPTAPSGSKNFTLRFFPNSSMPPT
jgi:hypothetical protein